jgi:hypothetical protein
MKRKLIGTYLGSLALESCKPLEMTPEPDKPHYQEKASKLDDGSHKYH